MQRINHRARLWVNGKPLKGTAKMINFLKGLWRLHSPKVWAGVEIVGGLIAFACMAVAVGVVGWFWVTGLAELFLSSFPSPEWSPGEGPLLWMMWILFNVGSWAWAGFAYLMLIIAMTVGRKDVERTIRDNARRIIAFYRDCKLAGTND